MSGICSKPLENQLEIQGEIMILIVDRPSASIDTHALGGAQCSLGNGRRVNISLQ